ncbi:LOW QUALITY PROTEIN: phospholipid phosphatase 1-like [Rhinolophus ferrumequinum]|uniref:LOW QUALITY PROTEIN: phospholipid phosphatase 1-like n=1 Tax=Rhinolophus ferrumequinum TaxID=59479 RepID=UPI00140FBCC5|nr:LOW QUALITY PROTEIN: phospholipid phosphatase 1-like [Rhinolophus ferrumequinum]
MWNAYSRRLRDQQDYHETVTLRTLKKVTPVPSAAALLHRQNVWLWTCSVCCWINLGERMHVQALQLSSRAFMSSAYMAMVSKQLGAFMFGGIARFSLTSMATKITNHLSPHFLAMCLPHLASSFNCESSYVTNYTCTRHPEDILDARE